MTKRGQKTLLDVRLPINACVWNFPIWTARAKLHIQKWKVWESLSFAKEGRDSKKLRRKGG